MLEYFRHIMIQFQVISGSKEIESETTLDTDGQVLC